MTNVKFACLQVFKLLNRLLNSLLHICERFISNLIVQQSLYLLQEKPNEVTSEPPLSQKSYFCSLGYSYLCFKYQIGRYIIKSRSTLKIKQKQKVKGRTQEF